MASIRKVRRKGASARTSYAWEVRYRDPQRRERSKTFRTKGEAEGFADSVETDIDRGQFLDPRLGKKTFGDWAEEWLEARGTEIKPTTHLSYRGLLDVHLLPAFGGMSMAGIRPLDVQKFLGKMTKAGLSRSRLRQARQLLSMILNAAVANGYIARNPVPRGPVKGKEPRRDEHPLEAGDRCRVGALQEDHQVVVEAVAVELRCDLEHPLPVGAGNDLPDRVLKLLVSLTKGVGHRSPSPPACSSA